MTLLAGASVRRGRRNLQGKALTLREIAQKEGLYLLLGRTLLLALAKIVGE